MLYLILQTSLILGATALVFFGLGLLFYRLFGRKKVAFQDSKTSRDLAALEDRLTELVSQFAEKSELQSLEKQIHALSLRDHSAMAHQVTDLQSQQKALLERLASLELYRGTVDKRFEEMQTTDPTDSLFHLQKQLDDLQELIQLRPTDALEEEVRNLKVSLEELRTSAVPTPVAVPLPNPPPPPPETGIDIDSEIALLDAGLQQSAKIFEIEGRLRDIEISILENDRLSQEREIDLQKKFSEKSDELDLALLELRESLGKQTAEQSSSGSPDEQWVQGIEMESRLQALETQLKEFHREEEQIISLVRAQLEQVREEIQTLQKGMETQQKEKLFEIQEKLKALEAQWAAASEKKGLEPADEVETWVQLGPSLEKDLHIPVASAPIPAPVFHSPGQDDLALISGIGEQTRDLLRKQFSIQSFRQLALLTEKEIKAIAKHMKFKDRILRDDWMGQARELHWRKYNEILPENYLSRFRR